MLPGCYDEWILGPREQLRDQYQWVLEQLVSHFEKQENLGAAIMYSQRLLRQDPLLEKNYHRLMVLHLANGDRAGVLNVYRQCARALKHELDIEPGPAIAAIMQQAREPAPRKKPASTAPASSHLRSRSRSSTPPADIQVKLPAQTTIFIGRERELTELGDLLRRNELRLVTLTGAAGTGKTRLAIRAAASLGKSFPDGVFFISLAANDDPNRVIPAIGSVLGVAEELGHQPLELLAVRISHARMLLLIDNFEHLLSAAPALAELLALCPQLRLLVTSRSVLNLRGEHEFPVAPLPLPPRELPPRPDDMLRYEAVYLFADRAQQVSPTFAITSTNARHIVEICRKLDGLPLAIELAAARVKVLSPKAILSRLDRRFKLLVDGPLDLPPRQRALETAIAWSYRLLDHDERSIFRGLSVFSGGWSLRAAEEMLGTSLSLSPSRSASPGISGGRP